jgi:hypothetical protein
MSYPAHVLGGEAAVFESAVAVALCLVPTVATLAWAGMAANQSPEHQVVFVFGGTGIRMGAVLLAGLALYRWVPSLGRPSFLIWLLVFYLLTLALEMVLLVAGRGTARD